jgi:hypothetical protein
VALDNPVVCLETIGRFLAQGAPEPWSEIAIKFTIIAIDDVCEYVITYKPKGYKRGRPKQFFVDETDFHDCFFELAKLSSTKDRGFFETCVYTLRADGSYSTDFTYGKA